MERIENLKFFIVDDDPFYRMLYRQHLLNLGFKQNILFDNGQDCIDKIDLEPDVIFLDYDMKPVNGLEVLLKIKRCNPNIHLLLISGQKDLQVAVNALNYGASGYIIKGEHDLEMISSSISRIFKTRELQPEMDGHLVYA